jgi:hypothetical protein
MLSYHPGLPKGHDLRCNEKFSSKCIDPNCFFYWFECLHMICPNLSSAPCMLTLTSRVVCEFQEFCYAWLAKKLTINTFFILKYKTTASKVPLPILGRIWGYLRTESSIVLVLFA